jgi:Fibrinogen beta and gamma chains, C-terminal globular domain
MDTPVSERPTEIENNDDIRIKNLELIKRSISEALARGVKLPLPENAVRIDFAETPLVHQGKTYTAFFDVLGLNTLTDPETKEPYDYALSPDGTKYQIIAHLDDNMRGNVPLGSHMVYSVGESTLFARDTKNQIISRDIAGDDALDVSLTEDRRKIGLENFKSCHEIYAFAQNIARPKSGTYVIDINGRGTIVFCDMQTDGGGWTLFYANNGHEDSPIAKSYVEMRETMTTESLSDLSNYDDPNLAGLLDFNHFTTLGSKEVLIRNRTGDVKKWVKFTFSAPRVLTWAL